MKTLSALGFRTISTSDWIAFARGGSSLGSRRFIITFDDAYADLTQHALPVLLSVGFTATVFVPTALVGERLPCSPRDPNAALDVMSAEQIAEWSGKGISFGAHSRTHADLNAIDNSQLDEEIEGSKQELCRITGKDVNAFAYPYGHYNRAVQTKAAASFAACYTLVDGMNDASTPLSALRRSMVQHGDSIADVCLRVAYGRSVLERVRTAFSRSSSERRS
jgi:peptidoglycan/xylan/chitin deacetylase (PgdA/CDA1 family)